MLTDKSNTAEKTKRAIADTMEQLEKLEKQISEIHIASNSQMNIIVKPKLFEELNSYPNEIKERINSDYQNMVKTNNEYKAGIRNIFTDIQFSEEEMIFFRKVYEEFQNAGLKPNLIKATRLSSGMFNVDYISECYLGKVEISQTEEFFSVIKQGNKKATRKFDKFKDAKQFVEGKSDYYIKHTGSVHTYFMQYLVGEKVYGKYYSTLQDLIDKIPCWVKYVELCKKNIDSY